MNAWLDQVRDPGAEFRSLPLWVWNNAMTRGRITQMLEDFKAAGMGGVFVHPRPGLITPYLSEEWFALWGFALEECRRLGLQCNVYDENSYPSGFAGGQVMRRIPWAACMLLVPVEHKGGQWRPDGEFIAAWRTDDGSHAPVPPGEVNERLARGESIMTTELRRDGASPWTAWYPYTDLSRSEVAHAFLETTHEEYRKRFGYAFGKEIRAFFTDEPHLASAGAGAMYGGFPFSRHIAREYRLEHGEDLMPRVADLLVDRPGAARTRFRYYRTLARLFRDNYVRVLFDWCEKNGVEFTGHFMEHEWPYPFINPNSMDCYEFQHIPGIDLLRPQYDYDAPGESSLFLMTVRELNSAANQLGKKRRFCELHGVGGHDATFENFKRLIDWLVVHGVNYLDEHLAFSTLAGVRKYDHPQTFTDHSCWFPGQYRAVADYQARLVAALVDGKQRNRVLLLHPTATGWILANPTTPKNPPVGGKAWYDTPMTNLRDSQMHLVQFLCDHQVDFDLGDELLLARHGSAASAALRCGEGEYNVLVLPEGTRTLVASTLPLLDEFLASGGVVLAMADPPALVDGEEDARPAALREKHASRWRRVDSHEGLLRALRELAPPLVASASGPDLPRFLHHMRREHEDGTVIDFLANTDPGDIRPTVLLRGVEKPALLDLHTGEAAELAWAEHPDGALVELDLPRGASALLVSGPKAPATKPPSPRGTETVLEAGEWSATRRGPNALCLDYCDLTVLGETHKDLFVTHANRLAWQLHGHDRDLWDRGVQVGTMYLDLEFDAHSGFETTWRFHVEKASVDALRIPGSVRLAIENPQLYSVTLNGKAVDVAAGEQWLDECIRSADCSAALVAGENVIRITARPFQPLCEIDRIYLVGEFASRPAKPGWEITAPRALDLGDWVKQGLSMHLGTVAYKASVSVEQAGAVEVRLGAWEGACTVVRMAGQERVVYLRPCVARFEGVEAGEHEVQVEVFGTLRNVMGPHFDPSLRFCAGPPHWDAAPAGPVDGEKYVLLPYGLMEPPVVARVG